mgnify:CR=1 FL=1
MPYLAQYSENNSSSVGGVFGFGRIRETHVRFTKCRQLIFSVVMFLPHVPHDSDSVNGRPLRGLPAPSFMF